MDKAEIKAQAEAYCENPKAWRKSAEGVEALLELPAQVQAKVREILEGRRGFRRVNGVVEFTQEALDGEIARLEEKKEMYGERAVLIDTRISELKAERSERFGTKTKK